MALDPNHKKIEYGFGLERVVASSLWKGNQKRLVVTAYDSNNTPNPVRKKLSSDSGRRIDMDLFSPQDDSLRGSDDNFNERLANSPDSVKNLNSISVLFFSCNNCRWTCWCN